MGWRVLGRGSSKMGWMGPLCAFGLFGVWVWWDGRVAASY